MSKLFVTKNTFLVMHTEVGLDGNFKSFISFLEVGLPILLVSLLLSGKIFPHAWVFSSLLVGEVVKLPFYSVAWPSF